MRGWAVPIARVLALIAVILLVVLVAPSFMGRLPGDVHIQRPGFSLVLPVGTMIVVSLLASVVLALLRRRR